MLPYRTLQDKCLEREIPYILMRIPGQFLGLLCSLMLEIGEWHTP